DTPGHADFGGEVERVLKMADGVLLLVDAFEGPMPQTRFVLGKALELDLPLIVVVNKCDRPDARPDSVVDEVFDLLVALNASDERLDFSVVYASGRDGWAARDLAARGEDVTPLLDAIIEQLPSPVGYADVPLQMLITSQDYSPYVGRIAIGRVFAGAISSGQAVTICHAEGLQRRSRALKVYRFEALGRAPADLVSVGDLCAVEGIGGFEIGDTIACPDVPHPIARVAVDEPDSSPIGSTGSSGRTWRCGWSPGIRPRSSACPVAGCCTWGYCLKTCGAKGTSCRWVDRRSSKR
ncbi:MAG: GTP-binding protein, partial [Planctomycetota bacterium]